jgi:hypothetical protein
VFGFAVMGGPGLGLQMIAESLKIAPESESKSELFNKFMYAIFWAIPIWLIINILYIAVKAGAITLFVSYFIHLYPHLQTALSILGIFWLWTAIGITGAIVFVIGLLILKYWFGALSTLLTIWERLI